MDATPTKSRHDADDTTLQDVFRAAHLRDPGPGDWITFPGNELAHAIGNPGASSPAATVEYRPGPCEEPAVGVLAGDLSGRFGCLDTGRRTSWLLVRAPQLSRFPLTIPVATLEGLARILERMANREPPTNPELLDRGHVADATPS